MNIHWSGWIWAGRAWKKVCEKGNFTCCTDELYEHAKAAAIKDPTRLAITVGNIPAWIPQAAAKKASDIDI